MKTQNKIIIASLILAIYLISFASALTISSVKSSPNEISPGEKVDVMLRIENNQNNDATDVKVSLNLNGNLQVPAAPFFPYQSSNEAAIEKITEDSSKEVDFELIADSTAESGIYKIPVTITYTMNSLIKTDEGVISLIINAKPNIVTSVDTSFLIKGQNNKLTLKVVNSGLGNAKFLSIKLNSVSGARVIGQNNVYIGNLDSDDFDTADFNIFVNENAPSLLTIDADISYKDSRNNEIIQDETITARAYTQKEATSLGLITANNTLFIVIGIVFIVILFFIYRAIRRRKRKQVAE